MRKDKLDKTRLTKREKEALIKLQDYFQEKRGVLFAYLFGSSVYHPQKAKDSDIAVFLEEEEFKKVGAIDAQIKIWLELSDLIRDKKFDIVVLNEAPLLLRHEVLRNGRVIFERDREFRIEFEINSLLKFYDTEPLRRLFWEDLRNKIMEISLGD
jgi:predicted nucleotidyltransferase